MSSPRELNGRSSPNRTVTDPRLSSAHLVGLNGLRGIGVLIVMAYHFGVPRADGGWVGVDMFFVVSGFVVSNNLLRSFSREGWLATFWLRRLSRLMPVLLLVVATVGIGWATQRSLGRPEWVALVSGGLMQYNLGLTFAGAESDALLHLWSLSVEFHYYIVAPTLLLFVVPGVGSSMPSGRGSVRSMVLLGGAASVVLLRWLLLVGSGLDPSTLYLNTPTHIDGLLLGTALAAAPWAWLVGIFKPKLAYLAMTALALVVLFAPRWFTSPTLSLVLLVPIVVVATSLLVVGEATRRLPPPVNAFLRWRPLTWVGERSYSLYLWHYVVGSALIAGNEEGFQGLRVFVFQVAATFAVATVSYTLVESRLRTRINSWWLNRASMAE